jgi:beta-xylosidase
MSTGFFKFLLIVFASLFFVFKQALSATVAVHDPSIIVVYKDAAGNSFPANDASGSRTKLYYIFGTQLGAAYSTDMINWTGFTPTFTVNGSNTNNYYQAFKAGADWSKHTNSNDVRGNLWAPDIIYNKLLNKWCLYFSVNGDDWMSSIVMHTSSKIEGPYEYAGTVVYSGMDHNSSGAGNNDYQKVTGSATVANRYLNNGNWKGEYGSSCIDPNVLYDENGKLWLNYGSWSGGIFLLKLDEKTGLRDYNYNYGYTNFSADGAVWNGTRMRFDPYMGIHIGGGYYVSGEGPYIRYLKDKDGNGFYYQFVTMGFYSPEGGYTMRVFRSKTIDGEYIDVSGDNAVFARWVFNYGDNLQYGFPIMQNYKWNWWSVGNVAQGHNSVLQEEDGTAYLVYHTKLDNGTVFHNVEVHQLFFNERGWPVASPFEYRTGFGLNSKHYTIEDIAGLYGVITHNAVDYVNLKSNTEQQLYINADGTLTGAYTGSWTYNYANGKQYITLQTNAGTFESVLCEQLMDGLSSKTLAFSGMNSVNERALWGYRYANTLTTKITNYRGQSLLVGKQDYSLVWNAYSDFHKEDVSGDFEVEYTFVNTTKAVENWHNWAIALSNNNETWYMRADAYSNSTFSGSMVNYSYGWNWDTEFKEVYKNKEVRVKISKIGTSINVFSFVENKLVYTSTATNCPNGNYTIYLGGEACYLDVKKVSVGQIEARQLIGTVNDDGTYTVAFNTRIGQETTVSGDFELTYTFNNYHNPVSSDNWDNFILRASAGGQPMLIRADAFALDVMGTVNYSYDWNWDKFLSILSGAEVVLNISRKADVIIYKAIISARDGQVYNYEIVNTQAPISDMTYSFTCEESMVDILKVEKISYEGAEVVTNLSNFQSSLIEELSVYSYDKVLYIRAAESGSAAIYSVDGKVVSTIQYSKGTTACHGLPIGVYIVNKKKVLVY